MASKLSKKHLFALSGTAVAVMLLTGCGASESSDDNAAAYTTNKFGVEFAKPGNQVSAADATSSKMVYIMGDELTGDDDGKTLILKDFVFTNTSGSGSYALRTYIEGAGDATFKVYGPDFVCGYEQPDSASLPNGEKLKIALDSVVALKCAKTAENSGDDITLDFASSTNYTFLLSYTTTNNVIDYSSFTLTVTDKASVDVPPLNLPVYVRGSLNGWGDREADREGYALTYQGNNVYALERELLANTAITYKVGAADWNAPGASYNCGAAGLSVAGECGPVSPGINVTTTDSGVYKFTVDYTSPTAPVFGFELVEAVELHSFGSAVGSGISNKLYFVSPELTSGLARVKGELSVGSVKNTYVSTPVRLEKGSYTFFVQDPSGTVMRFGGSSTTVVANRNNPDQPETGSVDVVKNSNEMITLVVEQAGDYVIGLDMRSATARIGVFADTPVYCKGTCVPEDFGAVVTADTTNIFLRGDITGSDWAAREDAAFKANGTTYTLTIPQLRAATYTFKFASLDWTMFDCGLSKAADAATELVLDGDAIVGYCTQPGDADAVKPSNITVTIPVQDDYTFTLDLADTTMPKFKLETGKGGEVGQDIWLRGSLIDANWSALPEGKLNKLHGNETYAVTVADLAAGTYAFKFADAEWANINCGGLADGTLVPDADPILGSCDGASNDGNGPSNLSTTVVDGTYTFVLDYNDPAMPTYQVVTGDLPAGLSIYVRGSLLDANWSALPEGLMQRVGVSSLYDVKMSLVAGDYQFKIADANWADTNCGAQADTNLVIDGPALVGSCDGSANDGQGPANLALSVETDGDYLVTIDLADPANALIQVRSDLQVYVRGSLLDANWSALPEGKMERVGVSDKFAVTIPVAAGDYQFKVADPDWAVTNCGAQADTNLVIDGAALVGSCDGAANDGQGPANLALSVETDGNYTFTIDLADRANAVISAKTAQ